MGLIVVRNRPPDYHCGLCGAQLYNDERVRHMTACVKRVGDDVVQQMPSQKMPGVFGPEAGDHEMVRWAKQHRRALLEDRKRL